jgi:hypothetical protein
MCIQQLFVYLALAVALFFLIRKFLWGKKLKKKCGDDGCGCH